AQHSFRLGGKRLRPALVLLTAQAVGDAREEHHTLATVVEMIHTATLVHDDVLDEAAVRRHRDTVNARWSNQTSVLLGDYLFTHAFYLASTLETTFGCRAIGEATNRVCEGELRQTAAAGDFWLAREAYLSIIDAKTAELCACCCRLGAHYAGADAPAVERFTSFGRNLGMAFQIVDDLLDLYGDERVAGKSLRGDFAHRKLTLPLIILRDQLKQAEIARMQALFDEPDAQHAALLTDWLDDAGAMQGAREVAGDYARRAIADLEDCEPRPARRVLQDIAQFVVERRA
ncbi:MAG TPA: polyprenyl synthetase family protein, partial [Lacipirellulaceae bacterium]|nr:polyprenyl synthetase family protein [Lacipirellulaceae bacterium]